ncbi:putative nucleic acid-binding protein [Amorphus suaedae]
MRILVDTCVVSEVRHPNGSRQVKEAVAALPPSDVFFSVITIGELTAGIARLAAGARRDALTAWLAGLESGYADRILPIDTPVAQRWGEMTATCRETGRTLAASDGLIAATASVHRMAVMTRNEKDFEPTGIKIINPWDR